jgi:DnaJ domain
MFEKAREFREKYYTPQQSIAQDNDIVIAGKILEKHAQNYCRKSSKLRSEILVLESEIELIQGEIDEFLKLYYEKFSEVLMESGIFSQNDSRVESVFDECDDAVSLIERRSQAYNSEVKSIYRKLVKTFHPDMNPSKKEREYFYRIQRSYESNDLTELLYIHSMIESRDEVNVIEKIEKFEHEIKIYQKKLVKLIEKKSELISTPEYKLFIKFRLSEVRGYNFFEELLKRTRLN